MARHDQATNDPILPSGMQIHTPDFFGTSAQRVAYPTAGLITGMQWTETDTLLVYKWTGAAWGLFGSAAGSSSLVFAYAQSLVTGQTFALATGVYAAII